VQLTATQSVRLGIEPLADDKTITG